MTLSKLRPLVSTHWLRGQLFPAGTIQKSLRVLDASAALDPKVDGYTEFYQESHIPHASYFHLHKLCPPSPSSHHKFPVPDVNRFQDYAESLGISSDTHVVAYDRSNTIFAFKTWWLFRLFGHDSVSVLDGGFKKWVMDEFEVSTEEPVVKKSSFHPAFKPALLNHFEDMVDNLKTRDKQVLDSREAAAFHNEKEKMAEGHLAGGHIPGSRSIPYRSLFQEDGTFKTAPDLKSLFDAAGVDLGRPVVMTCQRGMTACGLSAAAYILGKEVVPLYNGSFREWSCKADPEQIEVD